MIHIATNSKRGLSHPDWNEDNFYYKQTETTVIGGIFDGCSSGKDSFFASKLFANVYKNTIEKSKTDIFKNDFQSMVLDFFKNLYKAIDTIGLGLEETLSTAILFIYEIQKEELYAKFFGDGVVYSNNVFLEIFNNDEANQPDYIAYSFSNILENGGFNAYWDHKKELTLNTKDFTVSSDGIFTFRKVLEDKPDFDIISYLTKDTFLYKNPAALKRKLNIIRNNGYEHDDDFTAIRVIKED